MKMKAINCKNGSAWHTWQKAGYEWARTGLEIEMHAAALDFANVLSRNESLARYDAFLEGARKRIQQSISSVPIWGKVATSCGSVWQAEHKGCTLEMDLEKSQLYIMHDDHDGQTVSYKITPEGMDFLSCSGEDYCESWDDEDWYIVETSINF